MKPSVFIRKLFICLSCVAVLTTSFPVSNAMHAEDLESTLPIEEGSLTPEEEVLPVEETLTTEEEVLPVEETLTTEEEVLPVEETSTDDISELPQEQVEEETTSLPEKLVVILDNFNSLPSKEDLTNKTKDELDELHTYVLNIFETYNSLSDEDKALLNIDYVLVSAKKYDIVVAYYRTIIDELISSCDIENTDDVDALNLLGSNINDAIANLKNELNGNGPAEFDSSEYKTNLDKVLESILVRKNQLLDNLYVDDYNDLSDLIKGLVSEDEYNSYSFDFKQIISRISRLPLKEEEISSCEDAEKLVFMADEIQRIQFFADQLKENEANVYNEKFKDRIDTLATLVKDKKEDSTYSLAFEELIREVNDLLTNDQINALTNRSDILSEKGNISYIKSFIAQFSDAKKAAKVLEKTVAELTEDEVLTSEEQQFCQENILPKLNEKAALLNNLLYVDNNYSSLSDVIKEHISENEYNSISSDFKTIIAQINQLPLNEDETKMIHYDVKPADSDIQPLITLVTSTILNAANLLSPEEKLIYDNAFGGLIGPQKVVHKLLLSRRTELKGEPLKATYHYVYGCTESDQQYVYWNGYSISDLQQIGSLKQTLVPEVLTADSVSSSKVVLSSSLGNCSGTLSTGSRIKDGYLYFSNGWKWCLNQNWANMPSFSTGASQYGSKDIYVSPTVYSAGYVIYPPSGGSWYYDGNYHGPGGLGGASSSYTTNYAVGSYTAYYTPSSGYCWSDGSTGQKSVSYSIIKKTNTVTFPNVSLSTTFSDSDQTINITAASCTAGTTITYSKSSEVCSSKNTTYFTVDPTTGTLTKAADTPAGTYTVKIKADAADNAYYYTGNRTATFTITVGKATAAFITEPSAKSDDFVYTNSEQTLFDEGIANFPSYTTVQYGLSTSSSTQPTSWSTSIPTAKDAGTYYLWAKIDVNSSYTSNINSKAAYYVSGANKTISPFNLSSADIAMLPDNDQWTGEYSNPEPIVTASGNVLVLNTDYTYTYTNAEPITDGTYGATQTLTVTGKGNYNGVKTATYTETRKKYTITYDANDSAESLATNMPSNTDKYFDVAVDLSSKVPVRFGYEFLGWGSSSDSTVEDKITSIPSDKNENVIVYAIWKVSFAPYYINYYELNPDGTTATLKSTSEELTGYCDVPVDLTDEELINAYIDDEDHVSYLGAATEVVVTSAVTRDLPDSSDFVTTATINPAGNLKINLFYKRAYTVKFDTLGKGENPVDQEVIHGAYAEEPDELTSAGYTFRGWYNDQTKLGVPANAWNPTATPVTSDITVYAFLEANSDTPYKVEHYQQNVDGTYSDTPTESSNYTGTTDTEITPSVMSSYEGLGFNLPTAETTTIEGDGSTVVKYYYPRKTFTLTIKNNNSEYGKLNDSTDDITLEGVRYGTELSVDGKKLTVPYVQEINALEESDTDKYDYEFTGFTNGTSTVTSDLTVTANFTRTIKKYDVTINVNNDTYGSVSKTLVEDVEYDTPITVSNNQVTIGSNVIVATASAQDNGYTYSFSNWTSVDKVGTSTTLTANFIATAITYLVKLNNNNADTCDALSSYTYAVGATLPVPTREGYTFGGWFDNNSFSGSAVESISTTDYGNKEYFAKWTANTNTPYVVKHYKQDLNADTYTLVDTENLTGTSDATVTPSVKSYEGFDTTEEKTVTINRKGTTEVEYRYKRLANYVVQVDVYSETPYGKFGALIQERVMNLPYEAPIVVSGNKLFFNGDYYEVDAMPDVKNAQYTYEFDKWTDYDGNTLTDGTITLTESFGIYAHFKRTVNTYTVQFNDADGNAYKTVNDVEYGSSIVDTFTFEEPQKTKDHHYTYTFDHWDSETVEPVSFTTNAIVVNPVYSNTVNTYPVTFKAVDGAEFEGGLTEKVEYIEYGAAPTCVAPSKPKEGMYVYVFAGWSLDGVNPMMETLSIDEDWFTDDTCESYVTKTYTALFNKEFDVVKYNVTVKDDNLGYGTVKLTEMNGVKTGTPLTYANNSVTVLFNGEDKDVVTSSLLSIGAMATITATAKTSDDQYLYEFVKWVIKNDGENEKDLVSGTLVSKDTVLTAYFKRTPKKYKVTLHLNGGTVSEDITEYTCGNAITLPTADDLTRVGYTFKGWTNINSDIESYVTSILNSEYGDKDFYAQWEVNEYTITFDGIEGINETGFNSSATYTIEDVDTDGLTLATKYPVTKNGYTFKGWFKDGAKLEKITKDTLGDYTLTANWSDPKTYQLKYVTNKPEWTIPDGHIDFTETFDDKLIAYDGTDEPTRTIVGWYLTEDFSGSVVTKTSKPSDFNREFPDAITLYAKWAEVASYKVKVTTMSKNGADLGVGLVTVKIGDKYLEGNKVPSGQSISLTADNNDLYHFDSWTVNNVKHDKNPLNITVTEALDIKAVYNYVGTPGVTIKVSGDKPFKAYGTTAAKGADNIYRVEVYPNRNDDVTLEYIGDDGDFQGWLNNTNMYLTLDKSYTFKAIVDTEYVLKTKAEETDKYYVEFRSLYNQFIDSVMVSSYSEIQDYNVNEPTKIGSTFKKWVLVDADPEKELSNDTIAEIAGESKKLVFVPEYEDGTDKATITVVERRTGNDDFSHNSKQFRKGDIATFTATDYSGISFLYWATLIGDKVVKLSSSKSYSVHVTDNMTIYAYYSSLQTHTDFAGIQVTATGLEANNKILFQVVRDIPDKYELLSHGYLYSTKTTWSSKDDASIEDSLKFNNVDPESGSISVKADVKHKTGALSAKSGGLDVHLNVGSNINSTVYIRGYAIVSVNGSANVIYTDVYVGSYSSGLNKRIPSSLSEISDNPQEDQEEDVEF